MKSLIKVRNNNVVVRYIQRIPEKMGAIALAGHLDREIEHAYIVGVGPGLVAAAGGRPDTFDLKVGDYVLVHAKTIRKVKENAPEQIIEKRVPIVIDNETLSIVDQSQIIAVLEGPIGKGPAN